MDQRIVGMVAKLLQSGIPEDQIIQKLVEGQIPQEVAQQAIQEAKEALGGQQQAGKPEGVPSNSEGMAMMRQILTQVPPKVILFIIAAIMKMKGNELNALVEDLQKADAGQQEEQAPAEQENQQAGPASQQSQQQPPQNLQI